MTGGLCCFLLTFLINMYRSSGMSGARPVCEITLSAHDRTEAFVCIFFCVFFSRPAHVLKLCRAHRASGVPASQGGMASHWDVLIVRFDRSLLFEGSHSRGYSDWVYRTAGLEDTQNAVTWGRTKKSQPSSTLRHPSRPPRLLADGKQHNTTQHTGDDLDLGDSVGVTQDDTDLGRGGTLLGQLADLVDDLVGGGLEPRGGAAAVGDSRG